MTAEEILAGVLVVAWVLGFVFLPLRRPPHRPTDPDDASPVR